MVSLLSLFRTVSTHYLRKRWDRAALIIASIALGVAMLVSTQLLNACLDAATSESVAPGAENADLVVSANRRVQLDLLKPLRAVPGVQAAHPLIVERVLLPEFDNRTAVLIGLEVSVQDLAQPNPYVKDHDITNRAALVFSGRGAVVGKELAEVLAKDGKPVKKLQIRAAGVNHEILPGGTVELQGKLAKLGGFLLAMDVRQAAKLLNQEGICERIDLKLEPGADRDLVKQAAQEAIGNRAVVRTPEAAGQATREIIGGSRIGLTLCGIGAMVVGLFLV